MKAKAPAYQWYPKDILTSVRVAALSDLGELWYRRALDFCWLNGSLPADPETLARVIGRGCTVEGAESILHMFEICKKDSTKIIHFRQEIERKKQRKNYLQKQKAGIESAKRRKEKELKEQQRSTVDATAVEHPCNGNPTLQSSSPDSGIDTSNEVSNEETPQAASPPPKPARGSRIPDPFLLTSEMRAYGLDRRPDVDLEVETEKFVNYWRAKSGKDATKLDWQATWRNWILNARAGGSHHGATNSNNSKNKSLGDSAEQVSRLADNITIV